MATPLATAGPACPAASCPPWRSEPWYRVSDDATVPQCFQEKRPQPTTKSPQSASDMGSLIRSVGAGTVQGTFDDIGNGSAVLRKGPDGRGHAQKQMIRSRGGTHL